MNPALHANTGLLPDSKHVEIAELLSALTTLTGLIEEFRSLER